MEARSRTRVASRAVSIAVALAGVFAMHMRLDASVAQPVFRVPLPHVLTVADSLYGTGERREALQYLDSLVTRIRASGDARLLRQALYVRGRQNFGLGDAKSAVTDLQEAFAYSTAARDTLLIGYTMRWLATSLEFQARPREASAMYDSLRTFGQRTHDRYLEAVGIWGHATEALRNGDVMQARHDYETSVATFRELEATNDELYALLGLSALQMDRLEDFDGARRALQRLLELSRKAGFKEVESSALYNLAQIEDQVGDPSDAVDYLQQALRLADQTGNAFNRVYPRTSLASINESLGQLDDAVALYDSVVQIARENSLPEEIGRALLGLSRVRAAQGRMHEAEQVCRDILVLGDSLSGGLVMRAEIQLSRLEPTSEDNLRILRERARLLEPRLTSHAAHELRIEEASYLMRLRRYDAALRRWRALPSDLTTSIQIAACERELGRPDSALAALHRAARLWERTRMQPRDPEWREARGSLAREFLSELVDLTLASPDLPRSSRTRVAFDATQNFKSRTYLERMSGPNAVTLRALAPDSIVSVAQLQHNVLQEGELFLDAIVGDRVSFFFAVTRDSLRVARLPAAAALEEKVGLYRDLVANAPTDRSTAWLDISHRAAASVSQLLFGEFSNLLLGSRRLILSLDGPLHLLSFSELEIPNDGGPIAAGREIARISSATVLAAIRRREAGNHEASSMVVFATSRTSSEVELPGVVREARELAGRYANVRVHLNDPLALASQDELQHYDILHFASHSSLDDQRPWNSGFLLQPATVSQVPSRLRASEILMMRLRAQLCVLSGCESAAGKTLTGEGVQSLAGAFLCAGVPTVVATVWPVDDATSERLMRHLYRGLERGHSVASSLREAQDVLRHDSRTRLPFYWAGFVVVGEPGTRLALERRTAWVVPGGRASVAGALAVLLAGVVLLGFRGQRGGRALRRLAPAMATGLLLLVGWFVYDRARSADDTARLRSGGSSGTDIHLRTRGSREFEWDRLAGADSYRLQIFNAALEPLADIGPVADPHCRLADDDPKLASAPVLARVVALRSASTVGTSHLRRFELH